MRIPRFLFNPRGEINMASPFRLPFWICVWGRLGQTYHVIIVTSLFSESSVFKMFSVHTKTQSSVFKFLRRSVDGASVGRASHRHRGRHGFESRWSPDFFRLLLSNSLNWKIYCDDHSSLSSTTAVQKYELFHIYFTSRLLMFPEARRKNHLLDASWHLNLSQFQDVRLSHANCPAKFKCLLIYR